MKHLRPLLLLPVLVISFFSPLRAFSPDSLFEPVFSTFEFLPDYYLRFELSTFALHRDAFFKRQYLAEPHPDLEFRLLSFRDIVSSVWNVDFLFGLGEVPGNNVFTVLNVAFGIDPKFEIALPSMLVTTGLAHHCYHEIDKSYFPLVHNNWLHAGVSSTNVRLNDFFHDLHEDSLLHFGNRFCWLADIGWYLKEFFGLVGPDKLNGNSPLVADVRSTARYAFTRRRSWIFTLRGETTAGVFSRDEGYRVKAGGSLYWRQGAGIEAHFMRGNRGGCFYCMYYRDDLPVPPDAPEFTLGNSRFSKNGLAQIGIIFFN
ncbi:MAG: hypothetical protein JW863_01080 [Chitinispirillaceae bacterium]|nr:hypothetical protein [Chitinispirillaceae bacterium]